MTHYRLYRLDDANHIRQAIDLDCADDDDATTTAATCMDGLAVEVWEKARKVVRLPAKPKPIEARG